MKKINIKKSVSSQNERGFTHTPKGVTLKGGGLAHQNFLKKISGGYTHTPFSKKGVTLKGGGLAHTPKGVTPKGGGFAHTLTFKSRKKLVCGFTLIELLVVVAIIGILASVVLSSLNTARDKGSDAAVKANLANIRVQAEIVYDDAGGSYIGTPGVCNDSNVEAAMLAAANLTGSTVGIDDAAGSSTTVVCQDSANAWAVQAPLKTTGYWCVDSTGASKAEASNIGGSVFVCS